MAMLRAKCPAFSYNKVTEAFEPPPERRNGYGQEALSFGQSEDARRRLRRPGRVFRCRCLDHPAVDGGTRSGHRVLPLVLLLHHRLDRRAPGSQAPSLTGGEAPPGPRPPWRRGPLTYSQSSVIT